MRLSAHAHNNYHDGATLFLTLVVINSKHFGTKLTHRLNHRLKSNSSTYRKFVQAKLMLLIVVLCSYYTRF